MPIFIMSKKADPTIVNICWFKHYFDKTACLASSGNFDGSDKTSVVVLKYFKEFIVTIFFSKSNNYSEIIGVSPITRTIDFYV